MLELVVVFGNRNGGGNGRALWLTPYPDPRERAALHAAVRRFLGETMGAQQRLCMVVVNGAEQQVFLLDFAKDSPAEVEAKLAGIKAPLEAAASIRSMIVRGMKDHTDSSGEALGKTE